MIRKPQTTSDKPTDITVISNYTSNSNYKISKKALKEAIDTLLYKGKKKV